MGRGAHITHAPPALPPSTLWPPLLTYLAIAQANRHCFKYTLSKHSTSPVTHSSWCFICVWFRPFILILSHWGGWDSRRCASVRRKPTQSTWNSKKVPWLLSVAAIPLFLLGAFVCFRARPPVQPAVLVFVGEGRAWVRFRSFCFQKAQNKSAIWHILHH